MSRPERRMYKVMLPSGSRWHGWLTTEANARKWAAQVATSGDVLVGPTGLILVRY